MKKAFISFDFDHDKGIKEMLVGQSRNNDTPFEIADWSVKEHMDGDWKKKVRTRIKKTDVAIILCGEYKPNGVNEELKIIQEEGIAYFHLAGYKDKTCLLPNAAKSSDKLYKWTWDNLKTLIRGGR